MIWLKRFNFNSVYNGVIIGTRALSFSAHRLAIKNVTVVGGGQMGLGIAEVAAAAGNKVNVLEINLDAMKAANVTFKKNAERFSKGGKFKKDPEKGKEYLDGVLSRVSFFSETDKAVQGADLVVEAIVENLEIKQKLFENLDKLCPPNTILGSNTSSLPIGRIFKKVAKERKGKTIGIHFFGPVQMMKLVEVIKSHQTSEETFKEVFQWTKDIKKVPVDCKDTPGFIVNRLLVVYVEEAYKMLERGEASYQDIDVAMKLGCGHPLGPFELSDNIGLDVILFITDGWEKVFPGVEMFKVPQCLRTKVKEGKLGRKSGEGWYKYDK